MGIVTGSAQKGPAQKDLKASIGCRQSDRASCAHNLRDQPQPRVLINLTGIDQNKPIQYVYQKRAEQSPIGTERVDRHKEAMGGLGKGVPGTGRRGRHTGNDHM